MATNPYANVFGDALAPQQGGGRYSFDATGDGGDNITIGGGYTMDMETGALGLEITDDLSIDI